MEHEKWKLLIEIITHSMNKRQRIFNDKYNKAIITLLHRKFSPMHQHKKHVVLANIKKTSNTFHTKSTDSLLPALPSAQIYNLDSNIDKNDSKLIDRVKQFLEVKRRQNHFVEKKSELQEFISIFERPVSHKERAKRQSIEFRVLQYQKKENIDDCRKMVGFIEEEVHLDDDARSILNAKIRRKLNHKKIIDVARRS